MRRLFLPILSLALLSTLLIGWNHSVSADAPRQKGPTLPPIIATEESGQGGTAVPPTHTAGQSQAGGRFSPPVTLDALIKQYPDLKPYLDKVANMPRPKNPDLHIILLR
jgi:hypothetical protein